MKRIYEGMAKFFEEPTRDKLRDILKYNTGELDNLDFKKMWPEASKIARHILAFSNSGGGAIVVGVEELEDKSLLSCGITEIMDKSIIDSKVKAYLPSNVSFEVLDFSYKDSDYGDLIGKSFQVLVIDYDTNYIPFLALKPGSGIAENAIYIRRGTSSVVASYDEVHKLLNARISTNYDTSSDIELEEHLVQLRILYNKIDKEITSYVGGLNFSNLIGGFVRTIQGEAVVEENPFYPNEEYDEYISKLITLKKSRIERLLDL